MRRLFCGVFFVIILLAGCDSDTKRMLGLSKQVPDEFSIVTGNPLVVPPDFELPPPVEASSERVEHQTETQAKTALIKEDVVIETPLTKKNDLFTGFAGLDYKDVSTDEDMLSAINKARVGKSADLKGDDALLAKMKFDPDIRKKVTDDYDALVAESESFAKKLLFWQDNDVEKQDLIDAAAEKKRIEKQNAVSGTLDGGVAIHK